MRGVKLAAPVAGWLTSVRDVPDPVFSEEMMGSGIAIDPTEGIVVAPCAAQVVLVAPTRHAVTLRTDAGAELLIHIGLDTVALEGRGFEADVSEGDRVAAGDILIRFDLDAVGLEAKSLVTPIVLTNPAEHRMVVDSLDRLVARGEPIGFLERVNAASQSLPSGGEVRSEEALVGFAHGLHARPAARIADCAKRFASEVTIRAGGRDANARSPTAIMALDVKHGDRVVVSASGEDSAAASGAVVALLKAGEDEQGSASPAASAPVLAANEIGGVCALPGIAVGTAIHWRRQVSEADAQSRGVEAERAALEQARALVRARLEALGNQVSGPAAGIARAHIGLLDDETLNAAAAAGIEQGKSAAGAWKSAISKAASALRQTGNPMLEQRVADLDDVSNQLTAVLRGEDAAPAVELPEGAILIADDLLPSELLSLRRGRLAGLAIGGGGPTSHVAIIAASFGIPTLTAMGPGLARVAEGARVLLDAGAGKLVIDPDDELQARAAAQSREPAGAEGECVTRDGERVTLLANLGGLADVEPALAAGAEGCGLLRTEFLFLDRAEAPTEEEQRSTYQAIADALGGRPLTIRTLDIGGDKPVAYIHFPPEQNPALGARGIRTGLFAPELMDAQLRAIAAVKSAALKVMFPMVSSAAELRPLRQRMNELGADVQLGVMVETPAAALGADGLAAEADFLSIGSNDLAQYALAMDRTNPLLAASIDALHPAVLRLIAMTVDAGRRSGKPVSLCGNLASDPFGALVLVGLGISTLSAVPAAIPAMRQAVARVSAGECRSLAERALQCESAADVRALAAGLLNSDGEQR